MQRKQLIRKVFIIQLLLLSGFAATTNNLPEALAAIIFPTSGK